LTFKTKNKYLFIILILALLVRITYSIFAYKSNVMIQFEDDKVYYNVAKEILSQGIFLPDIEKLKNLWAVDAPPGLPFLISMIITIYDNWLIIFIVNSVVNVLTCILIFIISNKLFNRKIAYISLVCSSLYILFMKYIPTAGKEIWLSFLLIVLLTLLLEIRRNKKKYLIFVFSLVFTLLIHIDERYISYFPIFAIMFFIVENNWKTALYKCIIFCVFSFILFVPWTVRNYFVFDKIIIITLRTEHISDKLFGYSPKENYYVNVSPINKFYLSDEAIDSIIKGYIVKTEAGLELTAEQIDAMRQGILPHKFSFWEDAISSFLILWKPIDFNKGYCYGGYRYDGVWSIKHNLSVGLTYGILLVFSFFGFYFLWINDKKFAVIFLLILVYHTIIHMIFIPFTRDRYRIPIDPVIIILGSAGIYYVFRKITNNFLKKYNY